MFIEAVDAEDFREAMQMRGFIDESVQRHHPTMLFGGWFMIPSCILQGINLSQDAVVGLNLPSLIGKRGTNIIPNLNDNPTKPGRGFVAQ